MHDRDARARARSRCEYEMKHCNPGTPLALSTFDTHHYMICVWFGRLYGGTIALITLQVRARLGSSIASSHHHLPINWRELYYARN